MTLQRWCAGLAIGLAAVSLAHAQDKWPSRPITLVSPYAPGGTTDVLGRMLAQKLQEKLGQTVIVENKAGAGGNVGTDYVSKAKPDGYTLLLAASGPIVIAPSLFAKLPYNPSKDLSYIAPVAKTSFVVTVNANSGLTSLKDLIAKGKTGKMNFASAGAGTPQHIIGEMFNVKAGTKLVHIPYRGSGPALNDLLAGTVPITFENPLVIMPHVQSGKLKALAITGAKRSPVFPDIPTAAEVGLPGFSAEPWYGVLGPAGLPADTVQRLNEAVRSILGTTEVKARLFALGVEPMDMTQQAFTAYVTEETKKWTEVVKTSGATAD